MPQTQAIMTEIASMRRPIAFTPYWVLLCHWRKSWT